MSVSTKEAMGLLYVVYVCQQLCCRRGMTEELSHPLGVNSPESDCNSNHTNAERNGETTISCISNASSQDVDFIQDNSDYQWFLDYGYRDGSSAPHLHHHASVLSTSYPCHEPAPYYDDLAKNLDANLAEVDMEDFRTEDIHSILTTLPAMCCGEIQTERQGEMFASVSGSMMAKFDLDSSMSPHTSSQSDARDHAATKVTRCDIDDKLAPVYVQGDSAGSTDTMSICKSELLFSPVKECALPSTNFSVDSLDCDLLSEHDMMLTCQANKDNYTITFEGSMALYSEDSDCHETAESVGTTSESTNWTKRRFKYPSGRAVSGRALDTSMARSDSVYTTWSKLKKRSSEVQLTRHPSGNNNTCSDGPGFGIGDTSALKSQSLPNLYHQRRHRLLVSIGNKLSSAMSSSVESSGQPVKLYDVQHRNNTSSILSETNSSVDGSCSGRKQHNFSLVKLFMKQKSISNEGMCYAMDQSSASECWPTSNNSQSEIDSDSYAQETARHRSMNASCNNACHNHLHTADDVRNENDSCTCLNDYKCPLHDTVTEYDNKVRLQGVFGGNNGNVPKTDCSLLDGATNNWIRSDEITTDYSTCCFEDSLVEPSKKEENQLQRQHELIEEEEDQVSERSESVEQLSESFSKIEESTLDMGGTSCMSDQPEEPSSNSSQCNTYKPTKPRCNAELCDVVKNGTQFNVNNNNSVEREDVQSLVKRRPGREQSQGTQTKRLSSFGSSLTPLSTGGSLSNCSSSDETDTTRMQRLSSPSRRRSGNCILGTCACKTKSNATQIPVYLMNRSMQTSGYADVNTLKSSPFRLLESPNGTSLVKIIEPSFTGNIGHTKDGEIKKPLYVFYPNYTLPDLGFLKEKRKDIDVNKVFLLPQRFSGIPSPPKEPETIGKHEPRNPKRSPHIGKSRRPFSCNDVEALRKKGFGHIRDWDSLTFLLPREYRQFLAEVPEIVHHLKAKDDEMLRPLFCVSPTLKQTKSRPVSCDCGSFVVTAEGKSAGNNGNVSSSSSTATQPSSGYRGSSTMLLTDSSSNHPIPITNYNPLFVYRYDSVSSESSMMVNQQTGDKKHPPALPKRSISLPSGGDGKRNLPLQRGESLNQTTPPRPPLPRGILRKSMDNNCKTHKNNANNKRYSMFELGSDGEEYQHNMETKNITAQKHRRSLHGIDFSEYLASLKKADIEDKYFEKKLLGMMAPEKDVDELEDDEGVDAGTDSSFEEGLHGYHVRPPTPPIPKTPDTEENSFFKVSRTFPEIDQDEDIVKLEEFLNLSGLSLVGSEDNLEGWNDSDMTKLRQQNMTDDSDMTKLRQQVSKFLSNKQTEAYREKCMSPKTAEYDRDFQCKEDLRNAQSKKTVSFADKICVHVRDEGDISSTCDKTILLTPPNSPNSACSYRQYQCKLNPALVELPICEEGDGTPEELSSPPSEVSNVTLRNLAQRPVSFDLTQKRVLVTAVSDAVEQMISHFSAAQNQTHCGQLGDSGSTPACAHLALSKLCPALYAVLCDGLKPSLETAFGAINNSVWQVVEASAQQGPMTKALNELVLRLNSEDVLTEGLVKFNAFVFGLLNVRSLDAWASYLRTRESILRKHYNSDSLLLLSNTAGASMRALIDQLVASLQPLSLLPFKLDLLFECRQLHLSLQRMEQPLSSSSPPKQWTFKKLVRSIQSSLTQSTEEDSPWFNRRQDSSRRLLPGECNTPHHPNCKGTTDPPLPDLLDSSVNAKPWPREDKPRPRSCVDAALNPAPGGFSLVNDIASTMKKRWSGIHLGSKLFQAFDRLAAEDTEEEYTDSLENTPRVNEARKRQVSGSSNNSTSDDCPETVLREKSASPVPTLTQKESDFTEQISGEYGLIAETVAEVKPTCTGTGKFRRLQMKWEMLSGKESSPSEKVSPSTPFPGHTVDSSGSSSSGSVTTGNKSKIPRLVPSPIRASGIPVLSPQQSGRGNVKKASAITPPTPTGISQLRKPTAVNSKYKPPQEVHHQVTGVKAGGGVISKRPLPATTRCSRLDQLQTGGKPVRPSSLPYRPASSTQGSRGASSVRKPEIQRRAASSSLNRQKQGLSENLPSQSLDLEALGIKLETSGDVVRDYDHKTTETVKQVREWVRTLSHRLPSDSGHLSFNEGERLRVVLDVDSKWLLCCRGDQKGLVPRSVVIAVQDRF
uniref:(California timema) hypothetical protein n=1 Tax=Timema californicum TaxID=61474 RepID=A0A7R9IWW1_TIMCA|nr:unnamed protein product [Timema californicum]